MMIIINIRAKIAILKPLLYSINFEKLFLKIVEKHSGSPHNNDIQTGCIIINTKLIQNNYNISMRDEIILNYRPICTLTMYMPLVLYRSDPT